MRSKKDILGRYELPFFLLKCKTDFKFFCEKCLGIDSYGGIHEFQMQWFRASRKYKRLIIEAPAGFSKTEVMGAAYPLWLMFCERKLKILLVCKTMEQSTSNMLSRIKRYIEDNELLKELFIPEDYRDSWNATEIKTKNGHWVKVVPYNVNIRSYRADLILPDEIDSYEDSKIFFEHVLSRLYPDAQLIGFSTPTGPTNLIGQLKERNKAGLLRGWYFLKTTCLVDNEGNAAKIENRDDIFNYKSIWPEWWTLQKLHDKWGEQGRANWMRNYMCEDIGEVEDAIFPIKNIIDSFDYKIGFSETIDPDAFCVISADMAISEGPKADSDAYIVTESKSGKDGFGPLITIKTMETYRGLDTIPKMNRIEELYHIYERDKGTIIVVDPSLVGLDVMRGLQARGLPVVASTFQPEARKKMYRTLSNVLASKRIIIPRCPEAEDDSVKYSELLKNQLIGFRRTKSVKSGNEIIESKAPHDDLAASLAMNINEAIQHEDMDCLPLADNGEEEQETKKVFIQNGKINVLDEPIYT